MRYLSTNFFKKRSLKDKGILLFKLGIFFLPSTLFVGLLFLLSASIIGSFLQKKSFLKDKWNYPFFIFGFLISLSAFLQNFHLINNFPEIWDPRLSIIGLGNWLPFIWFYWALQPYIDTKSKRKLFSLILIAGTFPVLMTGFGQYFFNWNGPFETLNGLIIWYQRPIESPGGLSGLFSNQNYAGAWLNLIWPFCLALFYERRINFLKKTFSLGFLIGVGLSAFLTFSRNAWFGLITSVPVVLGKKSITFLISIILIIILVLFYSILINDIQNNFLNVLKEKIFLEFSEDGYVGLDSTRLEIFLSAIKISSISPIFGVGASSFTAIFQSETDLWKGHSHNLPIELAISYGWPATIILLLTISLILYLSAKNIFFNKKIFNDYLFDRALWSALFFFTISQLADIQYFDGKISMLYWIILAGLKNIILENKDKNYLLDKNAN